MINRDAVFKRAADGSVETLIGVAEDITEQDRMEAEVRDLSDRLLHSQLEERRLVAEDLHDSTAQHLIGADLALARIRKLCSAADRGPANIDHLNALVGEAQNSLEDAKREIRVQTYLLHPPFLESGGLGQAIAAFAAGFGTRAGLKIRTHVDAAASAIGDELAVPLFRVCQEALTNIHRHAQATTVTIALTKSGRTVTLTIADDGVGIDLSDPAAWGVGLAGMRERMQRLGGALALQRGDPGTRLVASVPEPR
jgi:signal transduction histidine kinase